LTRTQVSFFLAIGWVIVSFILLTLPGSSLPKEDWLDKIWLDKWIHIGMFAIMVVLWCRSIKLRKLNASPGKFKRVFFMMGIVWLGYGIAMELVQKYFIANRSFDIGDILANAAGCASGVIYSLRRYIKK
jgi:VanZ family protein